MRSDEPPLDEDRFEPGFLSRWSRLKQQAEDQAAEAEPSNALSVVEESPPPALTDADMPPIESLTEESDYSGFLSPKVTEQLRQQALHKLFRSACFNVCDGLDDYAEDFTSFEKLGDVITADLKFRLQQEAEKLKQQMAATEHAAADQPQNRENGMTEGGQVDNAIEQPVSAEDGDETEAKV